MYSVTQRIGKIKQPRGGYIKRKEFTIIQLEDGIALNENENIRSNLVGLAVDYLTRFMMGTAKENAFSISLLGASTLDYFKKDKKRLATKCAKNLLKNIKGLDNKSITNACKLVGFDVCTRAGIMGYKPVEEINPDAETIKNIAIMINRIQSFWKDYGPITKEGFTFDGGYTDVIVAGDGDYLSKDTLWDFKVSKAEPTSKHTLQLLVYYIMGMHSVHEEFRDIKKLGIYNPRMNKVYILDVNSISANVIEEVSRDVIGYP